jgi:fatty-acyl-CoA synthase
MAAIVAGDDFDFGTFADHLAQRLQPYADPLFVRISASLEATETFKQKKQRLIRDGFDPGIVTDPLFLRDPALCDYRPIDRALHARLLQGTLRL